jgi:hypothetical protein
MARSLASFPEDKRKAKAMFRLENCNGLSKCGAMDYFRAVYAPIAKTVADSVVIDPETLFELVETDRQVANLEYSSYEL